jgi:mitosis inhibitor protein kinase SWE1
MSFRKSNVSCADESLGIMLLEASTNIVLPSNGDRWVKLRNDDFSDLDEHYVIRGQRTPPGEVLPVISVGMLETIKGMMRADPARRMTLQAVRSLTPLIRVAERVACRAALVEENDAFLLWLLSTE